MDKGFIVHSMPFSLSCESENIIGMGDIKGNMGGTKGNVKIDERGIIPYIFQEPFRPCKLLNKIFAAAIARSASPFVGSP